MYLELDLYSQAIRFVLESKDVRWRGQTLSESSLFGYLEPWCMRLNPTAVYPVLFIDGQRVVGLKQQLEALELELGGTSGPSIDRDRYEYWVEEFIGFPVQAYSHMWADGTFEQLFDLGSLEHLAALESGEERAPALAEQYQALAKRYSGIQQIVADSRGKKHLEQRLVQVCKKLNRGLEDSLFLAGNSFTAADVLWATFFARLEYLQHPLESFDVPLPALNHWYERIKERKDYEAAAIWHQPRHERLARNFLDANRLPVLVAVVLGICGLASGLVLFFAL
jgi:glutathione S-transferase